MCLNPAEYSSSLTAVLMPDGHNEVEFRKAVLEHFNMSLGRFVTPHTIPLRCIPLCPALLARSRKPSSARFAPSIPPIAAMKVPSS